jgi:hypothetical protein
VGPETPGEVLPVTALAAIRAVAIGPTEIRVGVEIPEEPIRAEALRVAEEIAIGAPTATITEIITEVTTGTLTFAIACPPTTTRSFIRRAAIRITVIA